MDEVAPPGPVLDVGAGEGSLLDALRARGREAVGLERAGHRPDMRDEPVEAVEGDGDWAAVIFWHSLEHLPMPGFSRPGRREAAGGRRHAASSRCPNTASLQARVFGPRWLHLDLPRHIVHLSRARSRQRSCSDAGFAIERVSYVRGGQIVIGWLDGLVGALPGDLRLYQALRRPAARSAAMPPAPASRRAGSQAYCCCPWRRSCLWSRSLSAAGGTVYVEGRRERSRHRNGG